MRFAELPRVQTRLLAGSGSATFLIIHDHFTDAPPLLHCAYPKLK
jgi:hypothetical protein